jgi:hypothetical protein
LQVVLIQSRAEIASAWVQSYHEMGRLINVCALEDRDRAQYGGKVYERLSERTGGSVRTLRECAQFHRCYPIWQNSAKLGWSHFSLLCQISDPVRREKLTREAERQRWTTGKLKARVRDLNAAIDIEVTPVGAKGGADFEDNWGSNDHAWKFPKPAWFVDLRLGFIPNSAARSRHRGPSAAHAATKGKLAETQSAQRFKPRAQSELPASVNSIRTLCPP